MANLVIMAQLLSIIVLLCVTGWIVSEIYRKLCNIELMLHDIRKDERR